MISRYDFNSDVKPIHGTAEGRWARAARVAATRSSTLAASAVQPV